MVASTGNQRNLFDRDGLAAGKTPVSTPAASIAVDFGDGDVDAFSLTERRAGVSWTRPLSLPLIVAFEDEYVFVGNGRR